MSVLRLLSPARKGAHSPSSDNKSTQKPNLTINVPSYGAHFMNPPTDPLLSEEFELEGQKPRTDEMINGSLDVVLPLGSEEGDVNSFELG